MSSIRSVRVYSHRGCPGGDAALRYLAAHHIPFLWRDIARDATARSEWKALGSHPPPVVVVGRRILLGCEPHELEAALVQEGADKKGAADEQAGPRTGP
ncbi:MAG: hypothetical protein K6V97_01195 [Actinomycetia bacterium]|nr:hypothetical protein [Actinomycetes bacterium]